MKEVLENLFGFIYTLSMGDYFFFIGTFLLIVLFVYILYLIKCSEENPSSKANDEFDIETACKQIEDEYKGENIKLTSYEEEQEKTAIISYDELKKASQQNNINYDDTFEYELPSLSVKKFDLNAKESAFPSENKLEVKLMSYDKEEDFLRALKELQSNLNS